MHEHEAWFQNFLHTFTYYRRSTLIHVSYLFQSKINSYVPLPIYSRRVCVRNIRFLAGAKPLSTWFATGRVVSRPVCRDTVVASSSTSADISQHDRSMFPDYLSRCTSEGCVFELSAFWLPSIRERERATRKHQASRIISGFKQQQTPAPAFHLACLQQ